MRENSMHTPGPWNVGPETLAGHVWVYGKSVPVLEPAGFQSFLKRCNKLFRGRADSYIAPLMSTREENLTAYRRVAESNARLAAAAPELLEACEQMLEAIDAYEQRKAREKMLSAVTKAKYSR